MTNSTVKKYLVSVIMPVYNAEAFVADTIRSVLSQDHIDLELIIINDGSTDKSESVIQGFQDPRIKYFSRQNSGQCAASNFGITQAQGDYIKFFDADDLMNQQHISSQLKKLDGRIDSIASCAWARFYDGNPGSAKFLKESVWTDLKPLEWIKAAMKQKYDMMGAWLWMIPREILQKAGGWNETLTLNNDFEFSVRLLLNSENVFFVEDAKIFYRSGIAGALSSRWSEEAFKAALLSTELGCRCLLAAENSVETRLLCANRYQNWVHIIYPAYPGLVAETEKKIYALGGSDRRIDGGRVLHFLTTIFGWKTAKKLKSFFYSFGYRKLLRN